MNREQRRKATREFIKKGYTPQQAQAATALLAGRLSRKYLKEGEKVRLNGPALLSAYTANRLSEPFMAFVRSTWAVPSPWNTTRKTQAAIDMCSFRRTKAPSSGWSGRATWTG